MTSNDTNDTYDFEATYRTLNGEDITVRARRGTQMIGPISGPINATEFGTVALSTGFAYQIVFNQGEDLDPVRALLEAANRIASSRDETADKRPPADNS